MNAYLLLANGMVFAGQSVGAEGVTVGEVVFATGMVGFQETLTDPSYYGQIITQTYPLIGNYGMNKDDMESDKIWAKGYIVREACKTPSNWRCEETLDSFLKKNNTIGIEGIDTRHLTRIIRESGVMNGAILTTFDPADPANKEKTDALLAEIRAYAVTDAVKNVTCAEPEVFNPAGETHIVLMHYGCKRNIVRCLVKRGCKVTVMPAFATAEEVAAQNPDGIMLSNGPGDPAEPVEVIENLKQIFELNIPTFGICLGHQLSALAAGAKTMKLKYPNFAGIKYTYESLYEYNQCRLYKDGKFDMLHGQDETILPCLAMGGAQGGIGGTTNYNGKELTGILEAWAAGDLETARERQNFSQEVINVICNYRGNIVGGKRIMKLIGLDLGKNRTPFRNMTDEEEAAMKAELEAINFFERCNKF